MIVAPRVFLSSNPPTIAASTGSPSPVPRLVVVARLHLNRVLVRPCVTIPHQRLPTRVQILLANPDTFPECRRHRLVQIFAPPAPGPTTTSIR